MTAGEYGTPDDPVRIVVDALNLSHGGGSIVMSRIVAALMRRDAEVTLVTARETVLEALEAPPTRVIFCPEAAGATRATIFRALKMPALIRTASAGGVVSFNFHTPTPVPQITYHINVIPFLPFAERRAAVGTLRAVLQARGARKALQKSTANAFESEHLLRLARQGSKGRVSDFLAYTGIDIPAQAGARAAPRARHAVCMVTSGAAHKNNDIALRAFRAFTKNSPEARLDVFGQPEAIRASLSPAMADYCDNSGYVHLRGYVGRAELYDALSNAFALLTASELESFYMVALEAMIVGCPVVAADISSVRESTRDVGHLFPVGDWRAAADALTNLRGSRAWSSASVSGYEWAACFDADRLAEEFAARLITTFREKLV